MPQVRALQWRKCATTGHLRRFRSSTKNSRDPDYFLTLRNVPVTIALTVQPHYANSGSPDMSYLIMCVEKLGFSRCFTDKGLFLMFYVELAMD